MECPTVKSKGWFFANKLTSTFLSFVAGVNLLFGCFFTSETCISSQSSYGVILQRRIIYQLVGNEIFFQMNPYSPMTDKEIRRKPGYNGIRMTFHVDAQVENSSFALDGYFLMSQTFLASPYHVCSFFTNRFQITASVHWINFKFKCLYCVNQFLTWHMSIKKIEHQILYSLSLGTSLEIRIWGFIQGGMFSKIPTCTIAIVPS